MIRVIVIAPTPATRAGLRAWLAADPEIVVIGETARLSDVIELPIDAEVLVLTADVASSPDLGQVLESLHPNAALLLLADEPQVSRAIPTLPVRAWGLLPPDTSQEELVAAVRAIHEGLLVGAPALLRPLLAEPGPTGPAQRQTLIEALTGRETEVLQLMAQGLANKQIAGSLGISAHTVKFHIASMYTKLGVASRTEAVRAGVRNGLIVL